MANLSKIRARIIAGLKWSVNEVSGNADLEIYSDPIWKRHTIVWPTSGESPREIEYLHELAHAWLAENVHHLLSTATFRAGIPDETIQPLTPGHRAAADWFADALLREWCRKEADAEIIEHVAYILGAARSPEIEQEMLFRGGLILAQALHGKLMQMRAPARFRPVLDILVAFPPEQPSLAKMQALINRLAALTTTLRIKVVRDVDGLEVWDLE